jgi:hypothetical protein
MPGDEILPGAALQTRRAITINAPSDCIWPWLVQMGLRSPAGAGGRRAAPAVPAKGAPVAVSLSLVVELCPLWSNSARRVSDKFSPREGR